MVVRVMFSMTRHGKASASYNPMSRATVLVPSVALVGRPAASYASVSVRPRPSLTLVSRPAVYENVSVLPRPSSIRASSPVAAKTRAAPVATSLGRVREWCRSNRHLPIAEQSKALGHKRSPGASSGWGSRGQAEM